MVGARRSWTCWRRASGRSTSSPRRSGRASPIPLSTCRCSRRPGSCRVAACGTRVFYRVASEGVVDLWTAVRGVAAEHVASVEVLADAYLGDRAEVESVSMADLAARLAEGSVVLLDVRPRAEFRAGHLPDAVSVPIDELPGLVDELPGRAGGRGVLPRALLRVRRRRRAALARSRACCPPTRCRRPRVATRRAPRRGAGLTEQGVPR